MDTGHNPARALDATARARMQELGARLDDAEDYAYASGELHDDHDFEVDNVLYHDALACPWCRLRMAQSEYRAAAREPAIDYQVPPLPKPPAAMWHRYDAARATLFSTREFYLASVDFGAGARNIIDAAVAREIAIIDYEAIVSEVRSRLRIARAAGREAHERLMAPWRRKRWPRPKAVVDGYIQTGRTIVIDGERVPIVKRVGVLT